MLLASPNTPLKRGHATSATDVRHFCGSDEQQLPHEVCVEPGL